MKAFLTTLASKRLWAAVAVVIPLLHLKKWWEAAAVVVTYLAGESYRPTKPKA